MRSRLLATGATVVLFAGLMGSCKSAYKNAREVRIAYLQIIPSLPVFVAQEQQLFDKENLRLKSIVLGSSNDLVNAMVAGQADILPATSLVPIIHLEIQSPGRVRVFSHSRMNNSNALDKIIVLDSSPLHAIVDLQGLRIVAFPGTEPSLMLTRSLKNERVETAAVYILPIP